MFIPLSPLPFINMSSNTSSFTKPFFSIQHYLIPFNIIITLINFSFCYNFIGVSHAMNITLTQNKNRINSINMNMNMSINPLFRSDSFGYYSHYCCNPHEQQNYTLMEKRQLFLRSYQFTRKRSFSDRIKRCLIRVKRVVLRSGRKLKSIKCGFYYRRHRNKNSKNKYSSCLCQGSICRQNVFIVISYTGYLLN